MNKKVLPYKLMVCVHMVHVEGFGGIERWGIKHQVSLYVDDLLLYVSDPLLSIPAS